MLGNQWPVLLAAPMVGCAVPTWHLWCAAAGLSFAGGEAVDPSKTLVLAVHDAGGMESPDFQVCVSGEGRIDG